MCVLKHGTGDKGEQEEAGQTFHQLRNLIVGPPAQHMVALWYAFMAEKVDRGS